MYHQAATNVIRNNLMQIRMIIEGKKTVVYIDLCGHHFIEDLDPSLSSKEAVDKAIKNLGIQISTKLRGLPCA